MYCRRAAPKKIIIIITAGRTEQDARAKNVAPAVYALELTTPGPAPPPARFFFFLGRRARDDVGRGARWPTGGRAGGRARGNPRTITIILLRTSAAAAAEGPTGHGARVCIVVGRAPDEPSTRARTLAPVSRPSFAKSPCVHLRPPKNRSPWKFARSQFFYNPRTQVIFGRCERCVTRGACSRENSFRLSFLTTRYSVHCYVTVCTVDQTGDQTHTPLIPFPKKKISGKPSARFDKKNQYAYLPRDVYKYSFYSPWRYQIFVPREFL